MLTLVWIACSAVEEPVLPEPEGCRPARAQSLLGASVSVSGDTPDRAPVAKWSDLSAWTVRNDERYSPAVDVQGRWLELELGPGVERVALTPLTEGSRLQRDLRHRRLELMGGAGATAVEIDLVEVVDGNWDALATPRLSGFAIEGVDDPSAVSLALYEGAARFAEPAQVAEAEVGGVLRPAWVLHDGVEVTLAVSMERAGELRWHAGGAGEGTVSVAGEALPVRPDAWSLQRLPLPAGDHQVVLRASGGLAYFGDPRAVEAGERCERDVMLHLVDTLRADALRDPSVSPAMSRLAAEGWEFQRAVSTSSWTKPAIVSLFTSLAPSTHGVGSRGYTDRLPVSVPVLAEALRAAGWRTGSFTASALGSTMSALQRGFDVAVTPRRWSGEVTALQHPTGEQVNAAYLAWLDEEPDLPAFGYLHTLEPHQWTLPVVQDAADGQPPYEVAVSYADQAFGALMQAVGERGRLEGSLVVLASDHGESLGEHGVTGHGTSLWQEQVAIPLVFWGAGVPAEVSDGVASLVDVAPTVLGLLGLPPLEGAEGLDLTSTERDRAPFSIVRTPTEGIAARDGLLLRDGGKLVRQGAGKRYVDLASDPAEATPTATPPHVAEAMDAELAAAAERRAAFLEAHGEDAGSGAGDVEALRALGYVD